MTPLRKWTLGCGLGCLLPILLLIGLGVAVNLGGGRTIKARQQIEATLGTAADFTPWSDGRIPADRLERFLAIRRELSADCETFAAAAAEFRGMQELDNLPADEDPGAGEAMGHVWQAMRGMTRIITHLNAHMLWRNQLLLEHEMSLAEWSFLHVVIYYGYLEHDPRSFVLEDDLEAARVYNLRVRDEVLGMIARHVEDPHAASLNPDHARWFGELQVLREDESRVPFRGGVPARLAASLAPYRDELEALWCPATDEMDLSITEREGPGFEHI